MLCLCLADLRHNLQAVDELESVGDHAVGNMNFDAQPRCIVCNHPSARAANARPILTGFQQLNVRDPTMLCQRLVHESPVVRTDLRHLLNILAYEDPEVGEPFKNIQEAMEGAS